MIKIFDDEPLIRLAKLGYSASEIVEALSLPITVRQVQRIVAPHRVGERCAHCGSWLPKGKRKVVRGEDEAWVR